MKEVKRLIFVMVALSSVILVSSVFSVGKETLFKGNETQSFDTKNENDKDPDYDRKKAEKDAYDDKIGKDGEENKIDTSEGIDLTNWGKKPEAKEEKKEDTGAQVKEDIKKQHVSMVEELMSSCESLLKMEERTDEEGLVMLQDAYEIIFHAREAEMKSEEILAHRLISRIYIEMSSPDLALLHARKGNKLATENNLMGLELSYALEATARAFAALGEESKASKYADFAKFSVDKIKDKEAKEKYLEDLHAEPWFGVISWDK